MPVQNAANISSLVVYGTHTTIHTQIQTSIRANVDGQDEVISVNIVRLNHGNNMMAVITYEAVG